jgi:hypothetical protein
MMEKMMENKELARVLAHRHLLGGPAARYGLGIVRSADLTRWELTT